MHHRQALQTVQVQVLKRLLPCVRYLTYILIHSKTALLAAQPVSALAGVQMAV